MTTGSTKTARAPIETSPHASWNFRRGNGSVRILVQLGQEHGLTIDQILQGSSLTQASLDDLKGEIEATDELTVIANLVRLLPHVPGLGIEAGARYRLTTYGIWGYALISSPTLLSAAQTALRYLNLTYAFTHISMQTANGVTAFTLGDLEVPAEVRRFVVERDAVGLRVLQKDIFRRPFPCTGSASRGRPPLTRTCTPSTLASSQNSTRKATGLSFQPITWICPCRRPMKPRLPCAKTSAGTC